MRAVLRRAFGLLTNWFAGRSALLIASALVVALLVIAVASSCTVQEIRREAVQETTDSIIRDLVCGNPDFAFICKQ